MLTQIFSMLSYSTVNFSAVLILTLNDLEHIHMNFYYVVANVY